jgi:hypothetical protein
MPRHGYTDLMASTSPPIVASHHVVEQIPHLRINRLETTFHPGPWAFAQRNRAEIDAHFAALCRQNPALWNGRVLMLDDHAIEGSIFRGSFLEIDYASFLTWRDWGRPEAGVKDCFAQAALRAADGAFLLGVMAPHTAHPDTSTSQAALRIETTSKARPSILREACGANCVRKPA